MTSLFQRNNPERGKGVPRSFSNASYFHGSGALLPVTQQDRKTAPGSSRLRRRGMNSNGSSSSPRNNNSGVWMDGAIGSIKTSTVGRFAAIVTIFLATATLLKMVLWGSSITEELELDSVAAGVAAGAPNFYLRSNNYWQTMDEQKLPLSEYPSIQYALNHADIVLLYFAASWCPMSTPITQLLDEKFGDILLPPENSSNSKNNPKQIPIGNNKQRRPIALVYVSSDESEKQMLDYTRKNWIDVPFHSEERTALKKHFKVAAKRELEVLNMQRIYEIPAIIIVSGESHNVVTTHGVDDLKEKGSEALIHWIKLLHTVKALEDKY